MTNPTDGRITSLATAAALATSDLFSVVSPGNAASGVNYKLPFSLLATSVASTILPNAATGTLLAGQGVATAPSFVPVSGDVLVTNNTAIATTTIATHAVTFAKFQQVTGLSIPGVAGTAMADLAGITGTTDQVLRVAAGGTTLGFGAINLATSAAVTGVLSVPNGGTNTSTLTQAGILFGNGTSTIGITAAGGTSLPLTATGGTAAPTFSVLTVPGGGTGTTTLTVNRVLIGNGTTTLTLSNVATTGLALIGNGTAAAPGFAVLGVPGGGTNTTTLTAFGVVYGNGTSTVGITAAGGTGLPLVGAGGATAPSFAVLGVPGGGIGTGTTTPFAVLIGGSTATSQIQSIATTAASGFVLTSQGSAAAPIFAVSAVGVSTLNGQTGALVNWSAPQGRVTLTSGTPVLVTSVTAATSVIYTPYLGNLVPLYDGTNVVPTVFAEVSQTTTDATKSPAAVAANKNYDIFVWSDTGTIRATRGPAWSTDTTRGTGAGTTEITRLSNGLLVNANSITNGPAVQRGTYVGSVRSDGSSQINFIFGGSASGGTAAVLGVWNYYNRILANASVTDSGVAYTYSSSTVRQARASAGNQISVFSGSPEDQVQVNYIARQTTTGTNPAVFFGIGLDTTAAFSFQSTLFNTDAARATAGVNALALSPGLGWHVISANEASDGTNGSSFDAQSLNLLSALVRL